MKFCFGGGGSEKKIMAIQLDSYYVVGSSAWNQLSTLRCLINEGDAY